MTQKQTFQTPHEPNLILCQLHLIQANVYNFHSRLPFNICIVSPELPFFLQTTDDVIIISPWRNRSGYFPGNIGLYHGSGEFTKKKYFDYIILCYIILYYIMFYYSVVFFIDFKYYILQYKCKLFRIIHFVSVLYDAD